jgi:hypothetical protein
MTIKASGRALLAIGLLLGLASVAQAATADSVWPQVPQAASSNTQPRTDTQLAASDQLNAADRAVSEPAQTVQSTTVSAPTSQPDTQSVVPVVASSDEGSDTSSLIGKIFIAFGTLLTLGSAASKMLLT